MLRAMTISREDAAREALVEGFRERLYQLPDRLMEPLVSAEAEELGRRAAMAALAPRLWADVVGDRFTTADLTQMLGVSRQALAKRVASGTLLGIPGKGTTVYPTWQFDMSADPIRVRPQVAAAFAVWVEELGTLDPYAVSAWARTAQAELDELSPIQYLDKNGDGEELVRTARIAAARLAQ